MTHLLAGVLMALIPTGPLDVEIVDRPPDERRNAHYPGNREPLRSSPFIKLPIGAVVPTGWLRRHLELQADGFHGRLTEISPFLKKEGNAWLSADGQGDHGWEEVPYWLKGFSACAYILGDETRIAESKLWIEAALRGQSPDGMFGPRGRGAQSTVSSTTGPLDLWPNMVMLNCLQSYHEYTGDPRVIDLMTRYCAFERTIPDKDFIPPYWQQQRGADNLASVYWLYNRTGEAALLDLAEKIHRCTADWTSGIPDWHNVNMAQAFGGPATFFQQSMDPRHAAAAERNWNEIRARFGQVPGGMYGSDENCREGYTDPRQAIETCGMIEMMLSCERLVTITGDSVWADRCEDVAFNSLPAAAMPDFRALRYLTSPNQVNSDRRSKSPGLQNGGNMQEMRADDHRCCQHNFGHGWPYFAEHQWMATSDNGLAAVFLCASRVKAKVGDGHEVSLATSGNYPFDQRLSIKVEAAPGVEFPLYIRIPGWCRTPQIEMNRAAVRFGPRAGGYLRIARTWKTGDTVSLTLPMEVSLRKWKGNHDSVSVDRGPLTYSLKIAERYQPSRGTDEWPGAEILPDSPWNYGLVVDASVPAASFQVVEKPMPERGTPFTPDAVPIELRARARRIPTWQEDSLGLVGVLQPSPVRSEEPVEGVTLIPMGAARLRISSFPTIGDGPGAHEWKPPVASPPPAIVASHCFETDSVAAVADDRIPANSNDPVQPRMTWWDHRGTSEWIQCEFIRQRVSKVRVYWFDDEPKGGKCRTPASWRLLYRWNGQWLPVQGASPFTSDKDRFNEVTFTPVETDALRIEVQLRPELSAGILEWRLE